MEELKQCKQCGDIVPISKIGYGGKGRVCKKCVNEKKRVQYKEGKIKIKPAPQNKLKIYQRKTKIKKLKQHIKKKKALLWSLENYDKVLEASRKQTKKNVDNLTDSYIVSLIIKTSNLKKDEIYDNEELIKVTRDLLKLKRLIKTI